MAFQPIVNVVEGTIFAHENNESAATVFSHVNDSNRYRFDQSLPGQAGKTSRRIQVCQALGIRIMAEGVETYEELRVLRDFGIELFQGYYFAKPAFQSLATVPAAAFSAP